MCGIVSGYVLVTPKLNTEARSMELLVLPNNRRLPFDSGANLLEVLREHRVGISYSCMSGRCGTCRCRVIDGSVISSAAKIGRAHV